MEIKKPKNNGFLFDIYKKYKKGLDLSEFSPVEVKSALNANYLQAVMILDIDKNEVTYVFVPEENRFRKVR